ncbi:MAG: carboxypeptidase regulatory-like domain-containing protein, partial [Gemmatimonadaceae bacterium]
MKSNSAAILIRVVVTLALLASPSLLVAQGVTTASLTGIVTDEQGVPLSVANVVALHLPSGTQYRGVATSSGRYNLPNMRVGGPYRVTVTSLGYEPRSESDVNVGLGQSLRLDFRLKRQATELAGVTVTADRDEVLNAGRTGAATRVNELKAAVTPSIKRSTRDLTRLDPRSDGNMSFAGKNWLYNNISLDGSYFNNPFGLDDPAPGGQTNAEPVPYDAVAELQVSLAPFDVREGGFTGANINTVTKSGTNEFRASAYTFGRNDAFQGNTVSGTKVVANPDLSYNQTGASISGPLIRDRLFFYVNGEIERTKDPGSNFIARSGGASGLGVSRVEASVMDAIRERMISGYGYDPGPYQGYFFNTDNDKIIAKLDWNLAANQALSFRVNYLNAKRDLGPHPFVLSFGNTGRGPNESSLPFYNSGYAINNDLTSLALEHNSRWTKFANRFFVSYNRFRDSREPFSADFPTIDIGEGGVTYTTLGHEPFSIHNILDQDVLQLTNNLSYFRGKHVFTLGANFESFDFFNSFNIFRHGVFFLPAFIPVGSTFGSLEEFFASTTGANKKDFASMIGGGPFKGENIHVGQFSLYGQDELLATDRLRLTLGLRVDFPMYFTDPVDNPFSRGLSALDENRQPEVVDQSKLPDAKPIFSPRLGFNLNAAGNRSTQIRGGTGIFTGRVPFVWVGNVISNPGGNPNLMPPNAPIPTKHGSVLAPSFDLNAMDPDFEWPQSWTTDLAIDQQLPWGMLGTAEVMYSKDLKGVYVRNADLRAPVRALPDGRPYYGGFGNNELNPDGGAGIYVIDNTDDGYSFNFTGQLRKTFSANAEASLGYSYNDARNSLRSSEIASVLWSSQPNSGDPNRPERSYSEFGQRHRFILSASWSKSWSETHRTQVGIFGE